MEPIQLPPDGVPEDEPLAPFTRWFELAGKNEPLAETMTLATVTHDARPSLRAVLLRGFDRRGFVFYTNLESRKALDMADNPVAALCFHWKSLARQVRVEGSVEVTSAAEADAYFASRARESQIGAWASDQSRPLSGPDELAGRFQMFGRQYAEAANVPRPPNWSGFRIVPDRVEFWQERPHRLHDRVLFVREGGRWRKGRLYP